MINTLLEHVPIKMETKDEVIEVNDEDDEHIKDDDDVANSDEDDVEEEDDDEDEEDDEEEDEDEDEVLDVDQEVTLLISSDEEAELEAQRIRFPEKRMRKKSHDSKSSRSTSRNSNESSVSGKDKENDNSRNSNISSTSTKVMAQTRNSDNEKEKHDDGKEQMTTTKPDVVQVADEPKTQQRSSPRLRKENNKNLENMPAMAMALVGELRQALRRQSNNSTSSVGSSVASDCAETESCGNIYVYLAQQKLIFNCEFCDLKYGELESLGRHLHQAHRFFMQQDEDHEKENSPRNLRNRQNSQTPIQKQNQHHLSVKKEPFQTITEASAATATTTTTTTTATQLMPPVALNLDIQSEHSLQSCGNVFILNHRKLFLICGYCECKYANKELFERHLRQQHDVFEIPPQNEVNVVPKTEIKEEVFIITELVEKPPSMISTTEAMVTIPAEIPLDISTNEIIQDEDEEEVPQVTEVVSQEIVQENNEEVNQVTEEIVQEEREGDTQETVVVREEVVEVVSQATEVVRVEENSEEVAGQHYSDVTQEVEVAVQEYNGVIHEEEVPVQKYSDVTPERDVAVQQYSEVTHEDEVPVQQYSEVAHEDGVPVQQYSEVAHEDEVVVQQYSEVTHEDEVAVQQYNVVTHEDEIVEQEMPESATISEAVVLDDIPDIVTSTVISSSIQILDTGITIAEIPVVLSEESSAQISVAEDLIAVASASSQTLSESATVVIEDIQEIHESPTSPKRRSRKRRSSEMESVETAKSPLKRPKRNTRKIIEITPDSPESEASDKPSSRRRTINKKKQKGPPTETQPQSEAEQQQELESNNEDAGKATESAAASKTPASSIKRTTGLKKKVKKEKVKKEKVKKVKVKKEKEKKPRKPIKTKVERDPSPPRIIHIQPAESQISDRDEEFIEDPVADIIEQIQQEINNSSERRSNETQRPLPPTTLLGLTQTTAGGALSSLSPNIKPQMSDLNSPVDVKPIIYVLGERHFVCDQCPRSFKKHMRLVEHKRLHTGEKPFACDECGKKFRIRMRLNEHKLRHSKEKKFICEICNLGCCTKQDLNMHMRHHTNDRRFQCTMCPKAFVRSSDLKIHLRVHTGEKPYICDICHKCFRANQNLSVHKKSHMGEASKTYKCEHCDKKFMRKIDRKVHMRSHTGEKPFKCEICDRGYSSRFNVRAHIERDHISANGVGPPRGKKKPGPKPKALKEELEKQKKLIEELQAQLKRQIKTDEMIIPDDHSMNDSCHEESIMEATDTDTTPEGFEIIHSPPPLPLTAIPSPPCLDNPFTKSQKKPTTPATIMQKIEQHASSSSSMCSMTPSPQKQTTTKVVSQKTSLGIQQVSVTVSMQVENVATNAVMPQKENTSISNMQITAKSVPTTTTGSVKKERKITSYFTVLGQKAEV